MLSHDGAIVATAALDTILSGNISGSVTFSGLPGGSSSTLYSPGLYTIAVRAWNTSNPANTLSRQSYTTLVDLRQGTTSAYSVTID